MQQQGRGRLTARPLLILSRKQLAGGTIFIVHGEANMTEIRVARAKQFVFVPESTLCRPGRDSNTDF